MLQKYNQLIIGLLLGLLLGIFCGKFFFATPTVANLAPPTKSNYEVQQKNKQHQIITENNYSENETIPPKVYEVLKYVQKNHEAPEGYVGGREFKNREKQLPMYDEQHDKIKYQEWDVNPKIEGRNRGTERLVTGNDGRNWFTNNHYKTFTQLK